MIKKRTVQDIDREMDELFEEQEKADQSYRRALDQARKSSRGKEFRATTKKYIEGNNNRAKRMVELNDEICNRSVHQKV